MLVRLHQRSRRRTTKKQVPKPASEGAADLTSDPPEAIRVYMCWTCQVLPTQSIVSHVSAGHPRWHGNLAVAMCPRLYNCHSQAAAEITSRTCWGILCIPPTRFTASDPAPSGRDLLGSMGTQAETFFCFFAFLMAF